MTTNISLKQKMIAFCMAIGLIPFAAMGYYAFSQAASKLEDQYFNQLTSLRATKQHTAQELIEGWKDDISLLSKNTLAATYIATLQTYADLPEGHSGPAVNIGSNEYKELYKQADPHFSPYVTEKGYYDTFLVGTEGRILYTQAKESDLGQSLASGPLAQSGIADAWRMAQKESLGFSDFKPYAPSAGDPAAFIAKRITVDGAPAGTVVLQIPLDHINKLMQLRDGLGKTGETYLIGPDKLMRSDSFLDPTNHSVVASFRNPQKGKVDTVAAQKALNDESNTEIITDYNGHPVLSSFAPLNVLAGVRWAIIAEIDEAEAFASVFALRTALLIAGGVIIVLVIGATLFILRRELLTPLNAIQDFAGQVAGGNLDATARGSFSAEMASLQNSITTMVGSLKEKMHEANLKSEEAARQAANAEKALDEARMQQEKVSKLITHMQDLSGRANTIAERMSSAADELTAQVDQVSSGASIQRDRMQETATAMEQINATVTEVAQNSTLASSSSGEARDKAQQGAGIVQQAIRAIEEVNNTALSLKESMGSLGQQADSIGQVMTVISDIADQTNLLALNAAIEAARAGDAGRGFAVVADEVRKLAEKTMSATKEVGDRIANIQQAAGKNIESVDKALKAIEEATMQANSSGEALDSIVGMASDTAHQVSSIATAAEEQAAAMEEVSRSVEEVNMIVNETADGMMQAAEAVQELATQATELRDLIQSLESAGRED
ncbi:methyl-accepting chemotaxis protein [Oleidesulfovibrio sp.]|uniref:methyl-accepting chemotaxis protein n=1 Tax=Oleidesulfovibrio sp. TaxID=2909707 RepID=UPI003A8A346A